VNRTEADNSSDLNFNDSGNHHVAVKVIVPSPPQTGLSQVRQADSIAGCFPLLQKFADLEPCTHDLTGTDSMMLRTVEKEVFSTRG